MRKARLTESLVAAVAVATSLLVAPFASPAQAATSTDRMWMLRDSNEDRLFGLYYADSPGGTVVKVDEPAYGTIQGLSASADGSRIIYYRQVYVPSVDDVKQEIVVRDMSTRVVRVLETKWASSGFDSFVARLSPDGSRAVWELYHPGTGRYFTRKAAVASGAPTTLLSGYSPYAFLNDATVLVQTSAGVTYTIPFSGGSLKAASGIPNDAIHLGVSADGTKAVWALVSSTTEPFTSTVQVASLAVSNGVATADPATTIATGDYNRQPEFSRDGATVYWIKTSGIRGAPGDVWSAPVAGGSASPVALTVPSETDLAVTKVPSADTSSPGATSHVPAKLKGTQAVLDWTLPADADLSGTVLTRRKGSTTVTRFFPAPISYLVDSGLTLGTTYTYTFTPVDRAGRYGTSSSRTLTALQAGPTFADPTSLTSSRTAFPVVLGPAAGPATTFEADFFPLGGTPAWQDWVTGAAGRTRTFGAPASTGVAATTSTAGTTYAFRSRGHDGHGNSTEWVVAKMRATVPFDQTKASFRGGSNVYHSAAYLGSYRKLWRTTDYARVTLKGDRVFIVGATCGTCGRFDLFDNGTWVGSFDTYGSVTRLRQTLFAKSVPYGTHTFTIKPRGTAGRPNVMLDGFGMRTPNL